ncbi:LPS export ABC transporter permease LptG [Pigmentiphaga soli]|uniref:LPS export ABC transporter permease LptG n=1 Tax=Pigmentiphaga soli TaxID=1007095 RepID=UPI0031EB8A56
MNTARRYLATEIYRSSTVVLLALVGLFTFFSLVDDLDDVGRGGFTLYHLFILELFALPTRVYDILPIGLLIGSILALAGLAQRHELVILRVSGVSGMRLLGMLWVVTIPVVVLALLVAELLTPAAEIKLNEARLRYTGSTGSSSGMLRSGYWFKESTPTGERMINVAGLQSSGGAVGITLYEFNQGRALSSVVQAESATFETGHLALRNATINTVSPDAESALDEGRRATAPSVTVTKQAQMSVPTSLTPELLFARVLTPERMSFANLVNYIRYLSSNHLVAERQVVAIWRKVIYPFTLLAMVTIAAPLGFMQTRRGGVGVKVFVGILLGVAFFMLNQLSLNVGMLNRWPAWLTAVGPNAMAMAGGLGAMLALEYGSRLPWRRRVGA